MLKASGLMGVATLVSRVLGLVREIIYAKLMGDTAVAGAFHLAFLIPNLFRRLLGEGALTAAFVPIFKEKEKTEGEKEMWHAANAVLSGLIVAASVISGVIILLISIVLMWKNLPDNTRLMLQLLRIMFPYMFFVCIAAACMGMLNARGHFFIPALGAALLNVVMIFSAVWLAPKMGERLEEQIFALALGVLAAGAAQAFFQMPSLQREGFRFQWVNPFKNPTVKEVAKRMLPATVGVAAFQLNVTITQSLAFGVYAPIVASFQYAVRLLELPQGLFGFSVASWLLPALSSHAAEKKYPEFRRTLSEAVGLLLFVNLIAVVLMIVLAQPMVKVLFQRGNFTPESTIRVAQTLIFLAPGLLFFSTAALLSRAFYALGDTTTPVKISIASIVVNFLLSVALVFGLMHMGLAIASTFSAACNAVLLLLALRKKIGKLEMQQVQNSIFPLLSAAMIAGLAAWLIHNQWPFAGRGFWLGDAARLFVALGVSGLVYFIVSWWLKIPAARSLLSLVRRKL